MKLFLLTVLLAVSGTFSFSQTETERLSVFIECNGCDQQFIRQELTYLSYVRDRLLADVHIQVVSQSTGSGGDQYTFFFYGQNELAGNDDTLSVVTDVNNTFDEVRRQQLKIIKIGLANYMIKKGFLEDLNLEVAAKDTMGAILEKDPWNNWVFSLRANGGVNGQEITRSMNFNGGFNIDRITEKWKIESNLWLFYSRGLFDLGDTIIVNERRSTWSSINVVRSISDHWSIGINSSGSSSLVDNYKINASLSPAIEFNVFPYIESTKRQIRFAYRVGMRHNEYNETTIYDKDFETLAYEELGVSAEFQQKWGTIAGSVKGSHYFHNFDINRVNFRFRLGLRLFKGFTWNISGNLALIHDQISLAAEGATQEEILLSQQQLQTGYRYWGNMGFSYTFGSIFNSVVNPRFGD